MDCEIDFITDAEHKELGATFEGFKGYVMENPDGTWRDYLDGLWYAKQAERDKMAEMYK